MVLGPSGCGKDTQIDLLISKCEYQKIGTGEMFRSLYKEKTKSGLAAYKYWSKGEWVPDKLTFELFEEWLKKYEVAKPWIFSQVVRTAEQVHKFDLLLEKYDRSLDCVIYFKLSEEAAIDRMSTRRICPKCGADYNIKYKKPKMKGVCDNDGEILVTRDDDKPEAIRERLVEFFKKTAPIVEIYKEKGILIEIDSTPSIEEIHQNLLKDLEKWIMTRKK